MAARCEHVVAAGGSAQQGRSIGFGRQPHEAIASCLIEIMTSGVLHLRQQRPGNSAAPTDDP